MSKTGGAAFPREDYQTDNAPGQSGMTLRDYFATAALQGLISAWPTVATNPIRYEVAASGAYFYADAMLAERDK